MKTWLSAFVIALVIGGLLVSTSFLSFVLAENSVNVTHASTVVADTSGANRLLPVHDVVVRLPNGTLCATFCSNLQGGSSNDVVYVVSSNDDGATWGTPTKVSNVLGMTVSGNSTIEFNQGSFGPVIAADANNNVYVAWTGATELSTWQVWCTVYNGLKWSEPTQVSRGLDTGLNAAFVNICVDGDNKVHLVWDSSINGNDTHDYEHNRIFYASYNGAWGSPIVISNWPNPTKSFHFNPCIVVDSNNNIHVVWAGSNYPATQGEIWYTRYNGGWQAPIKITTSNIPDMYVNYLQAPSIAVDSNNNLHVVWQGAYDQSLRVNQIWYMKYSTSWSTPITISNVPLMNSSDQEAPSIAVDSNNNVHVLWMSTRESVMFYSRYDSSWSTPVQIEGYSSKYPHFRWSTFPSSNRITSRLDYVFFRGSTLMFNNLSTSELPSGPSFSVSVTPISEFIGVGQSLQYTSTVTKGTPPYSYQWYLNGTAVSGATSSLWIFKPETTGTYSVYVVVTDSDKKTVKSEPAQATATLRFLKGSFGYSSLSSEGGGVNSYTAFGSRFILNVEANFTSMSALMSTWAGPEYPPTYNYRFAIYRDNNNSIGSLAAQTVQGTAPSGDRFDVFNTANFPSSVHLTPGAYWLMGVTNAVPYATIGGSQTNDYNESVQFDIGSMAFPDSFPSAKPWLGQLYCIYASWEYSSGTADQERNLFQAISNSTVSSLAYDPATNELVFTVSGPPGTIGYTEIFISKTILQDPTGLKVTIDGKQMNFTVTSVDAFWALYFVYSHSTHSVAINMQANVLPTPTQEFPTQLVAAFLTVTFASLLLCLILLHKKRLKPPRNSDGKGA